MYYVEFDYCKINQIKLVTHWHGLNSTSPCVVNKAFALLEYVTLAANSSTHVHTYFAHYAAFGGCDYRNAIHVFWDYQISCFLYITSELHSTSFLPEASYGLRILSLSACVCVSVNHELLRTITSQPFKLGSPYLTQRCKRPWFRSLLVLGVIDFELQGQI